FEQALQAVRVAESVGSASDSLRAVRSSLEGIAHDLLTDARKELSTDPEGAKQKARQVLGIVEVKSPLYAQAQKLIKAPCAGRRSRARAARTRTACRCAHRRRRAAT